MNHDDRPLAVLVSDMMPSTDLANTLALSGYRLDVVHTIDAAVRAMNSDIPKLVVAGPFHHWGGLRVYLEKLQELRVAVVVVSDRPEVSLLAQSVGVAVRSAGHDCSSELTFGEAGGRRRWHEDA